MQLTVARVRVGKEKQQDVVKTIRRILEPIRTEPGCLGICCSRDIEDEGNLFIFEQWASKEDLERYIRSDQYRIMLSVLESSREDPEMRFYEVSETAGMEMIFEIRGGHTTG